MSEIPGVALLTGDAATVLATLGAASVQVCVTSPPYFQLRDYKVAGQIGLEATPGQFIAALVATFGEVRRVLRDDGTLWVNLGDSYGPDKQLLLIPHRFAIAMQDDGWYLRQDIVWAKPACMPESVRDRCTRSHEYIFMFAKQPRYYYDAEAIAQPAVKGAAGSTFTEGKTGINGMGRVGQGERVDNPTRNRRSVWSDISPEPSGDEHYAAYPTRLPELCLLAGSSPTACGACGSPWQRVAETERWNDREERRAEASGWVPRPGRTTEKNAQQRIHNTNGQTSGVRVLGHGWVPTCACPPDDSGRGVVLDPFSGSGSTGVAALRNGRRYVGIDLSTAYQEIATRRLTRAHYEAAYGVRHESERPVDGQIPLFAAGGAAHGN